jgi:hypothetical protein
MLAAPHAGWGLTFRERPLILKGVSKTLVVDLVLSNTSVAVEHGLTFTSCAAPPPSLPPPGSGAFTACVDPKHNRTLVSGGVYSINIGKG